MVSKLLESSWRYGEAEYDFVFQEDLWHTVIHKESFDGNEQNHYPLPLMLLMANPAMMREPPIKLVTEIGSDIRTDATRTVTNGVI
jgi:hypothetical protein